MEVDGGQDAVVALAHYPGLIDELLEVTADGVAVISRAHAVVWHNATLARLLRLARGHRADLATLAASWPAARERIDAVLAGGHRLVDTPRAEARDAGSAALSAEWRAWPSTPGPTGPQAIVLLVRDRGAVAEATRRWGESERRYRLLAEEATDLIVLLDDQGLFRYVSPSVRTILGYDADELLGRPYDLLLATDDKDEAAEVVKRVAVDGEATFGRSRLRHADGRLIWLEGLSRPVAGGEAVIQMTGRDVTERVAAETIAGTSARIDRALLEARDWEPALRIACRGIGRLIDCSMAIVYAPGDDGCLHPVASGGPHATSLKVLDPGSPDDARTAAWRAFAGGHPERASYRQEQDLPPGTASRGMEVLSTPIAGRSGRPAAVLTFVAQPGAPITEAAAARMEVIAARLTVADRLTAHRADVERQRLELIDANQQLEERVAARTAELHGALEELESFSFSVSHDLRAPLRAIASYAELLREDQGPRLDDRGQADLGLIQQAAEHLSELVDALLELSRVTRSDLERMPVDLASQCDEIATRLQRDEPDRQVVVDIGALPWAVADPRLTRVVLENLLTNAFKFTRSRPGARIEVGAVVDDDGVVVYRVADNGVGFEPTQAHRLFVAFQRLHRAQDFPGTGVGLATVARIVRRHGGRVWADATPGEGASFCFTLAPAVGSTGEA